MSLRLRLVLVFFLVSVVPLAALTWYTYTNNLRAVREAAQREADTLADELGQRTELVMARLQLRVGELVAMTASRAQQGASAEAAPQTSGTPEAELVQFETDRVRDVLGEMAVLLDNVQLFDRRGRGGRFGGRGARGGQAGPNGAPDAAAPDEPAGPDNQAGPPRDDPDSTPSGDDRPRIGPADRDTGPGRPPVDADRIVIDMAPIRRDIIRQFVPDGQWDQLSAEDRARVFSEVQQRVLGIRQGIDIIREQVAERAAAAGAEGTAASAPAAAPAPDRAPPAPAPAPPVPPSPPRFDEVVTLQRRSALADGRIDISLERDGEVVSEANAAINLPNLLGMVFASTRLDSGEVPFAVAVDGRLFAPGMRERETIQAIAPAVVAPEPEPSTFVSPEWVVVTRPDPTNSVAKLGIARPLGPAVERLRQTAVRNAGFGLAFIALALIAIVPLSERLTRKLDRLGAGVNRIAQGDYSARVESGGSDEVGRLALAFNHMAAEVEAHQRAAVQQERIRRELELGRQIQHEMLPHAPLHVGGSEVAGLSIAAREVGGDFFNYFRLADGTVALLVGDVSGKGVGAALLMANLQAALRTRLVLGQDLTALATELDHEVDRGTPGPVYATLFVAILDPERRLLRWVNAGHNPQYIIRTDGRLESMPSTGRPIGLLAGGGYERRECRLAEGDLLFFYTDGCVEAEDAAGGMFGTDRLEHTLAGTAGAAPGEAIAAVRDAVSRFRGAVELQDDATMMAARIG